MLAPDSDGAPSFDRPERVAAAVEALGLVDVRRFYEERVHEKPRLVDVRVRGRDDDHAGDDVAPVVPGSSSDENAPARAVDWPANGEAGCGLVHVTKVTGFISARN